MTRISAADVRKVLTVSLPLVFTMGATTVMEFTDRVFLGNYDLDALAAALPAGITSFLFTAFFLGVAGYVTVFIAQYTGAGRAFMVGTSLWQGIWFALFGAVCMGLLSLAGPFLFSVIGHLPEIQQLEVVYFRILCLGTGASLISATLGSFYSGRGFTTRVMAVHILGTVFNIPLDYALINGRLGLPELGIQGAALATVAAWVLMALIFSVMVFTRSNDRAFHVLRAWRFDPEGFRRLMIFGIPGGVQFCLDILAFTFFILMVGRLGRLELAVTNMVMSINSLSYMPMFGFSIGVSALVGQAMGAGRPDRAVLVAQATLRIAGVYVLALVLLFVILPVPLIRLFVPAETPGSDLQTIVSMGITLLRFVAVYLAVDSMNILYMGVLKGAGDSRFIMVSMAAAAVFFLFLPVWVGVVFFDAGLFYVWTCITVYLFGLCAMILSRYLGGRWKVIRMIGPEGPSA